MATQQKQPERPLQRGEWRTLAVLGIPTFALALAITTVSTYLPVLASAFAASTTVIGVLIGGEGLMALVFPLLAGTWSDRLRTRAGGRLPFILGATPALVLALALLGFAGSLVSAALLLAVFFAAYYIAYEPYRALYPDLVDDEIEGRAQSSQAIFRGLGTLVALVGGGLLISLAKPAPFVTAAAVTLLAIAAFLWRALRRGVPGQAPANEDAGVRAEIARLARLIRGEGALRAYFAANALWELSLAALKTFVILYITRGLGFSTSDASLIVGAAAIVVLAAAPVSGKLGDRLGRALVMRIALVAYGIGLLVPFLTTSTPVLVAAIPLVAFGGGVIMTLPYALLIPLMPEDERGGLTGFYSASRGVGIALGPLLAGVAISVARSPLSGTQGYQAMWLVCAVAVLVSVPLLRPLREALTTLDDSA